MAILQVGLKSSVWPRRKRWYRSFCRTRLQLARRGQNVAKNSATLCVEGWAGELKSTVLRDGRPWTRPSSNTVLFYRLSLNTYFYSSARPPTHNFPPVLERVALFLATFWPLLASWSRVGANGKYHSNQLDKLFHINPTCIFSELSL